MKSAALLRYDIRNIEANITAGFLGHLGNEIARAKVAKKQAELAVAVRRELKRLCKVLTYKADVYGPNGRIYSHEGKWEVTPGNQLVFVKVPGTSPTIYTVYNPEQLTDGHGQIITE
jgi:hypothetical protein